MNKDIDIREHTIIIKYDTGHEEVKVEQYEFGKNTYGETIRVIIHKNKNDEVVRMKVQNLWDV